MWSHICIGYLLVNLAFLNLSGLGKLKDNSNFEQD